MKKEFNIIPEIFASILSITAGIIIYISRIGFENYGILILKTTLISLYIIYTPCAVKIFFKYNILQKWYFSKSIILILCFITAILLGNFNTLISIDISVYLSAIGAIITVSVFVKIRTTNYNNISAIMYVVFILFGVWCVSAYSSEGYHHPLFIEKLITGAWLHRDSVWFSSMAGMFKTYNVSSNGLDGLVPVYYHNLSHYLFGGLSNLLNISTFIFYNLCVPILILPMLFYSLIICIRETKEYFSEIMNIKFLDETSIVYWLVLSVLFFMPFPLQLIGIIGGERYQYLFSGSYTIAFLFTFLLISIIFSYRNYSRDTTNTKYDFNKILMLTISVLIFFTISVSKVSFLFVLGSIYGYVYLRNKYFYNIYHNVTILGLIGVIIIVYINILNTETFLKNPYQIQSAPIILSEYILFIIPSIIYIMLKIYLISIISIKELFDKIIHNELIDIEILIMLGIILFILPFQYFKGIQVFFAYLLIMSHLKYSNKQNK